MRQFDPDLADVSLEEPVAVLLSPDNLFGQDVRNFLAIYREIQHYLYKHGAMVPVLSSRRIIISVAN